MSNGVKDALGIIAWIGTTIVLFIIGFLTEMETEYSTTLDVSPIQFKIKGTVHGVNITVTNVSDKTIIVTQAYQGRGEKKNWIKTLIPGASTSSKRVSATSHVWYIADENGLQYKLIKGLRNSEMTKIYERTHLFMVLAGLWFVLFIPIAWVITQAMETK